MKKQGKGEITTTTIHLCSPTGNSSVQVYDDWQRVAYGKMHPGKVHTMENGSHTMKDRLRQVTGQDGRGKMSSAPDTDGLQDQSAPKDSLWMIDSSSQAYSGPEDNSTDPHDSLTETSTLTFVDARANDVSGDSHVLHRHGVGVVYIKEFVLIDDDDDGDMSLREKTVTDVSVMDGNAADLVCGRLLSISSGSLSECKEESPAPEAPPAEEAETPTESRRCCFCTIL